MCKISFGNLSGQEIFSRGLLQFNPQVQYFQEVISLDSQEFLEMENNSGQNEQILEDRFQKMQNDIFEWFEKKSIKYGNPEDILTRQKAKQKAMLIPKKEELNAVSGLKVRMSNLMSRRNAKLLEVNVAG